jgi:transaldolase
VFVSPFVGRLDDLGQNGMDLIANILRMYRAGDGHVSVLTASVRTMEHFLTALALGSDIITSPLSVLKEWGRAGRPMPGPDYAFSAKNLAPIGYEKVGLGGKLDDYDLNHELTVKGMAKFSADWNALLGN